MNYIYIGKIVNTHGIKGELRLLSDFDKKELVFKKDFNIYIGNNYIKETINSYRHHKMFDMITLKGYDNINEVLKYKDNNVYINRDDLNLNNNDYVLEDLINLNIKEDNEIIGKVIDYVNNSNNVLLVVLGTKKFYIPLVSEYIIKVDLNNNEIITKNVKDLII
ncbi:MAG: 16S rRNA processing protein RimM [Bacilli bacterium]|nr:16S rRNA processing protein RimM [Bacilli bacterium]